MGMNAFEDSRVAAGTLNRGGQKPGIQSGQPIEESKAISRDDERDGFDQASSKKRRVLAASTLAGDKVRNQAGENLGTIEEIMLDIPSGRVAYAVLSIGGFLGIGSKLFAVPWSAMQIDEGEHQFVLDVDRATLENAPAFDKKDDWPDMADPAFGHAIHDHYGAVPYWEHSVAGAGGKK